MTNKLRAHFRSWVFFVKHTSFADSGSVSNLRLFFACFFCQLSETFYACIHGRSAVLYGAEWEADKIAQEQVQ